MTDASPPADDDTAAGGSDVPSPAPTSATAPDGPSPTDAPSAPVDDPTPTADVPAADPTPTADAPADEDPTPSVDEDPQGPTFADLDLRPELLAALTELGYEEPTPIQREAIGPLLEGHDLLGQAATGTGKTAAFALPLLHRIADVDRSDRGVDPVALVLVPTRELAMQVSEALHRYGRALGVRVLPVYGGQPITRQLRELKRGIDVVVATPGRAIDHLNRGSLRLDHVRTVVLDEADEMLDMGFAEDLETIFDAAPQERQSVLFSATMPRRIERLAANHLDDPVQIRLAREAPAAGEAPLVRQTAYLVARAHKPAALGRVLDQESPTAAIVFCRTRAEVDTLTQTLNGRGYRAEALHGGLSQEQRSRVIERLKAGTTELIVATDVAARGLDIDNLSHVVNYDVPSAPEAYVHRIGRVGRAGREGVAITLAQPREHRMLKNVERLTRQKIAVESVPTVADLRAKRLELTRAALRESILQDDLDPWRTIVEGLADEFDLMDVALAAAKLLHESSGAPLDDEDDIPVIRPKDRWDDRSGGKGPRDRGPRPDRGDRGPRRGGPSGPMTRLYVAAGRQSGVRPQDIVGAFAGESSLSGRDIGAIQIHDRFALVEVPADRTDEVLRDLRGLVIKGRKANVRPDRGYQD
ncbi:MAG: DEAD/DEAH box helicase [Solirubrobacteraceae bacterium]|nr:DEAD/DEAH box helicase [Solirubrobacteraceae bacterium]